MRIVAILLIFVTVIGMLISCKSENPMPETGESIEEEKSTDSESENITEEVKEDMKLIKVLAIGNSFSTDSMDHLYGIMKSAGVEEIFLGNLYYGGCSLQQHLDFAKNNSNVYKFHTTKDGVWKTKENSTIDEAIAAEDWDIITLQQTSKTCGLTSSYGSTLDELIKYVRGKNSKAKLVWNMTWAYQSDSTHASFPNYGKSQQKMYDMIINVMNECIIPNENFVNYIPCMTSVQNARTSFLGDTLTRDGYHLDYNIGRYIAALTWYASLTGMSVEKVTYNPNPSAISDDMLAVAKEAVSNAIKTPLAITESKIKEGKRPESEGIDPSLKLDPADFFEADKTLALSNGVDLAKYTLLEWNYLENTYWNCTSKAGTTTPGSTAGTYKQNVCSEKKYSLSELPAGTVFIADGGWQYRIDIYKEENKKYTGTRPAMITKPFFILTEEFMKDANYLAWNISSNPKKDISEIYHQAAVHLRIYVPNK